MKLNYKRTIFVGFAFFLICAFWQAYDTIIPKILTERFGINQTASGIIMALDNILALFMLPLFGIISDKSKFKMGRRTPFILVGTILSATLFVSLSFVDNAQLNKLGDLQDIESDSVMEMLYDYEYEKELKTPNGEQFVLKEKFTKDQFMAIEVLDENDKATDDYTNYVVPARQAYIYAEITSKDPSGIIVHTDNLILLVEHIESWQLCAHRYRRLLQVERRHSATEEALLGIRLLGDKALSVAHQ